MKKGSWLQDFVQPCVGFGSVMGANVADMIYNCLYGRKVAVNSETELNSRVHSV